MTKTEDKAIYKYTNDNKNGKSKNNILNLKLKLKRNLKTYKRYL